MLYLLFKAEECLRRIAARLCRLDACGRDDSSACCAGSKDENAKKKTCEAGVEKTSDCCAKGPIYAEGDKPVNVESKACAAREKESSDCCIAGKTCIADDNPIKGETVAYASKGEQTSDRCAVGTCIDDNKQTNVGKKACVAKEENTDDCCVPVKICLAEEKQACDGAVGACCKFDTYSTSLLLEKKPDEFCAANAKGRDTCCTTGPIAKGCNNEKSGLPVPIRNTCYCATPADSPKADTESSCGGSCCDGESDKESGSNGECTDDCCKLLPTVTTAPSWTACANHLQTAFRRYEALLAAGSCLCRGVLDQLGFCCCSLSSDGRIETTSSCASHDNRANEVKGMTDEHQVLEELSAQERSYDTSHAISAATGIAEKEVDIEQAAAREHIVLNISGMTCTGCSRKMMNVLDRIPGLSNAQVTFVSGLAEFDIDEKAAQVESILPQIERETGFKLSRISSGYQTLDVWMSSVLAEQFEASNPPGLVSIEKQKGKKCLITYNPRIIGARSLLPPDVELAPPSDDVRVSDEKRHLWEMLLSFLVATVFTVPVVILNWAESSMRYRTLQVTSLALATVVQVVAVPVFYVGAIKSLIYSRVMEMDMLVVISITAAYFYSIIAFALTEAGYDLEQGPFFETSSLLVTLVLFGRLMAAWARMRAVSAVSLRSLQAETALLLGANDETEKIDARLLQFGDEIKVLPHSRIVTDGVVVLGESAVDESMVTGESTPVGKQTNNAVIGGTMNGPGPLHVRVTRLPGENSIADIANLVEKAASAKPRIQDLADKFASRFIPAAVGIALVVFVVWIAVGLKVRNMNAGGAVGIAITYAIAVLAISCPCALGLAVPMVLVIAGGCAAREGVIIKVADAIERGHKVTDVVFDKTGTLTKGDLYVVYERVFSSYLVGKEDAYAVARTLAGGNDHPVSKAVAAYLREKTGDSATVSKIKSTPGCGVQAQWSGSTVMGGNPYWLGIADQPHIAQILDNGMTSFCLTLDGELLIAFGLKSTLREEATTVVAKLRHRGLQCHIVSGDGAKVVEDVALTLGFAPDCIVSRSSPAAKQEYIRTLQEQGKMVLFCGDGTNDAVAVTQANVGVQIGSASDVTAGAADVVLLGGLEGVNILLNLSKKAFKRIMFNFAWSAVYNTFAILLAAGAFVKFRIPPGYAGLGEIVSVAPVIVAAMTLVLGKKRV